MSQSNSCNKSQLTSNAVVNTTELTRVRATLHTQATITNNNVTSQYITTPQLQLVTYFTRYQAYICADTVFTK